MIKRVAGVDIGTNTVLMLIADYQNKHLKKVRENFAVARLGESLDKTGIIRDEAIERTVKILKENRAICQDLNVEKIIAVGTSALRDAKNSDYVLKALNDALGAEINVINGLLEATYSFIGTVSCESNALVIDIGGGSTELILGKDYKINEKKSLQIGAVRLTERFFNSTHPPDYKNIIEAETVIKSMLEGFNMLHNFDKVYAVAGTATTLATTALGLSDDEVDKADGYIMTRSDLTRIFDLYLNSSLAEIINKFRVHPRRADLILAGSLIMKTVVEHFDINEIVISSKGLRYGILVDFFNIH